MSEQQGKAKTTVVTSPIGIVCFAQVFQPKAFQGGDPKYSLLLVFDKSELDKVPAQKAAWQALRGAVQKSAVDKFGQEEVKRLLAKDKFSLPWRDGSEYEEYGEPFSDKTIFIAARSTNAPGIVNGALRPVISEEEFYSGCKARVTCAVWAFDTKGNKGITLLLNNIQKTAEGERLSGGRRDPTQDFEATEAGEGAGGGEEDVFPF